MPAEKATQQRRVESDFGRVQTGALGDVGQKQIRGLIRQPQIEIAFSVEARQGRGRLQLGVVEVLGMVSRTDDFLGAGQPLLQVALTFGLIPGVGGFTQLLRIGLGVEISRHVAHG
ncbi:hypothetical protein D3C75_641890 [compost metagenome]